MILFAENISNFFCQNLDVIGTDERVKFLLIKDKDNCNPLCGGLKTTNAADLNFYGRIRIRPRNYRPGK